jgi:DNA-binding transcriptional LysR family regulator
MLYCKIAMNARPGLDDLTALTTIAAHRSFRKAADELGLAASTLSHTMRTLEAKMGVRLLHRTTRSVSLTEAGERFIGRLGPILSDLDSAFEEVEGFRSRPSGTVRINTSDIAARVLMKSILPTFLARHPGVNLDIVTEGKLVDIVAGGFDAGIRLGEALPKDMIAVRLSSETRFLAVASPAYLARHAPPRTPDDLKNHTCVRLRMPSGKLYRWEFERRSQEIVVDVQGPLTFDNFYLVAEAATLGLGIAYVNEEIARPYIERRKLRAVLEDWCPRIPGLFLYYPGHRHVPPGLKALIEVVKELSRSHSTASRPD